MTAVIHGAPPMTEPWQVAAAGLLATALDLYREHDTTDHPERAAAVMLLSLARPTLPNLTIERMARRKS